MGKKTALIDKSKKGAEKNTLLYNDTNTNFTITTLR